MTQFTPTSTVAPHAESNWTSVCALSDILPGGGVCALVGGQQVAVFRLGGRVFALSNFDPFTRANVLSRGLTGSYTAHWPDGQRQERYKVASPLLKHTFDLETGACLTDQAMSIPAYAVRLDDTGRVWIGDEWTGSAD
ncbi:nitrite reductase small subunit NirD [Deinococcus radiomollis]|uniref:nitrite reductase small subunit NirD n=1 Tax=Deinococcus radiomollis TaxID=468916 RepID=UPI0038923C0D